VVCVFIFLFFFFGAWALEVTRQLAGLLSLVASAGGADRKFNFMPRDTKTKTKPPKTDGFPAFPLARFSG